MTIKTLRVTGFPDGESVTAVFSVDDNQPAVSEWLKAHPTLQIDRMLARTGSSDVYALKGDMILKMMRVRHWSEHLKYYIGRYRALEEVNSNQQMAAAGLKVPKILAHGKALTPSHFSGISSYYLMQHVGSEYQEAADVWLTLETHARDLFYQQLIADVKKLADQQCIYSDLRLANVMTNSNGDLIWIDTRIKHYGRRKAFLAKLKHVIGSFKQNSEGLLTDKEIQQFDAILAEYN